MNEVNIAQTAAKFAAASASSTASSEAKPKVSGKALPEKVSNQDAAEQVSQAPKISAEDLKADVATVNGYVQNIQRDLQFSVDEDLERTVIKVVDSDSGELIRQIPEDIFLELARRLKDDGEFNLLNALG